MIETLIYILIGYIVIRTLFTVIGAFVDPSSMDEDTKDINEHLKRHKTTTIVRIKMEQINGWWYGFYHPKEGGELFVAQGTTYDEAIENCRKRLQEGTILKTAQLAFDK